MVGQLDQLVRRWRLRIGLTQEELAERSGVSVRTIRRVEAGERRDARPSSLRLLADALDLLPDEREQLLDAAHSGSMRPALQSLPGDVPDFTGRVGELRQLLASAPNVSENGTTAVVTGLVDGMAGIGKTTLAVRAAHLLAARYPDGQLFLDLHGHTDGQTPTDPAAALGALLRALGVPTKDVPPGLPERSALWRAELTGRKVLVVLDNAADAAQVRPLLPGAPHCLALVTSRQRLLGLDVTYVFSLDVLSESETVGLLGQIVGADRTAAEPDAVAELVALCGRLPLAVRIAAARLRSRPAWSIDHLVGRLRSEQRRLDELSVGDRSVAAAFALSYQYLPKDQQRMFRRLGLMPGVDIDVWAAAALADVDVVDADRLLEGLVDAHLLQQSTPGRFRFHDLVGHHARTTALATDAESCRHEAQRRVVDFYLHTAHTGQRLINPHCELIQITAPARGCRLYPLADATAALSWFAAEHACLLATQQLAVARGWDTPVWQLAWTLDTYHYRRGHVSDWIACWQTGLSAAYRSNDPSVQSRGYRRLADAFAQARRHTDALDCLARALTLAERAQDPRAEASAHHALAWTWGHQGNDHRALQHALRALLLQQSIGDPAREADMLNEVGWFRARLGDYDQARDACEQALLLARLHGYEDCQANTLDSLGYIDFHAGRHSQAESHYRDAAAIFHRLGNTYNEADALAGLGEVHAAIGRNAQARDYWERALELYEQQQRSADVHRIQDRIVDFR